MPMKVNKAVAALCGLMLSSLVLAEIPIRDSSSSARRSEVVGRSSRSTENNLSPSTQVQADFFTQMQVLQEEVQNLRGLVESQAYELKKLKQERLDGYLNLDRRITDLTEKIGPRSRRTSTETHDSAVSDSSSSNSSSTAVLGEEQPSAEYRSDTNASDTSAQVDNSAASDSAVTLTEDPSSAPLDEGRLYDDARNLLKAKDYQGAIRSFKRLVSDYPDGPYAPNAYYWLGELYLVLSEHEKAKEAFTTLLDSYPTARKVPDTLYKLGVIYTKEENSKLSKQYFDKLLQEFPSSSAARLAQDYTQ